MYGVVVSAEKAHAPVRRLLTVLWHSLRNPKPNPNQAPLGAALTAQFIGARMGMISALDILSSNAAAQRRADKAGDGERIPLAPWKGAGGPSPSDPNASAETHTSKPSPQQQAWYSIVATPPKSEGR